MINCKKCQQAVYEYIDDSLDKQTHLLLKQHLKKCSLCYEYFQQELSISKRVKESTSTLRLNNNISSTIHQLANAQKTKKRYFIHFSPKKLLLAATLGLLIIIVSQPKETPQNPKPKNFSFKVHKTEFFYENTEMNYTIRIVE